jgi:hypothetical protein
MARERTSALVSTSEGVVTLSAIDLAPTKRRVTESLGVAMLSGIFRDPVT